jgi:hypothetical protein
VKGVANDKPRDVRDQKRFKDFSGKREEWLANLTGDDLHSIWRQGSSLLADYVLFLTLNDLRKNAVQNLHGRSKFNMPVMRLLVAGFVVTQATGIRRLTEKQWADPSKRVISLKALIDDIRKNRAFLTRETYLACRDLPFEPTRARQSDFDRIRSSDQRFVFEGLDTQGPDAWGESERAHKRFDKLSAVSPSARSRDDLVLAAKFDDLDSKIRGCEDVCVFVDKFIAHAADTASRTEKRAGDVEVTLRRLGECHQALLQISSFIGGPLLQGTSSFGLPTPQAGLFTNLDKPWVSKKGLNKAQEHWDLHAREIAKWSATDLL